MHFYHMLGAGRFPLHTAKQIQRLTCQEWSEIITEAKEESVDDNTIVSCSREFQKA